MNSRTTREPMKIIPVQKKAWEIAGTDIYTFKDKKYLIIVDYYSRYIETMLLKNELSETVILSMKSIFSRHGIPESVVSDNGRQFSSKEFIEFSQSYSFQHITSSPKHPQGNSVAERGVQTIKNILSKEDDPYLGLLEYRSTPLSFGISPAELLMGRRLNTTVPEIPKGLRRINQPKFIKFNKENKENNKKYRDNKYTIEKRELENNEEVFVKYLRKVAKIAYRSPESDRSYVLDTDKRFIRRNRQMIIPLKNTSYVTQSGRISKPPDRLIEIN